MTALSFDTTTTSPANPDKYRRKTYIARHYRRTVGYIFATDSIYASPSILKQSGLTTGASENSI